MMSNSQILSIYPKLYEIKEQPDDYYSYYINTLSNRMDTMQIPELLTTLQIFKKQPILDQKVLDSLVQTFALRAKNLEPKDLMYVSSAFATQKSRFEKDLYKALEDVIVEIDMFGNINYIETILWAFSSKNLGSSQLYEHLSKMLTDHRYFDLMSVTKLSKIAYYLARTTVTRAYGGFGIYHDIETKIYNLIHQGKLESLQDLIEVTCNMIGNNIGSNRTHALLELKLYKQLSKPDKEFTAGRLTRLVRAFTYYQFKLYALDGLIQQLVRDAFPILTNKELIQILWGYTRNSKADESFYEEIVSHVNLETANLRSYLVLLNGLLNVNYSNKSIWDDIEPRVTSLLPGTSDHYLVRAGLLYSAAGETTESLRSTIRDELVVGTRFRSEHLKDLARAATLIWDTEEYHNDSELLDSVGAKVQHSAYRMDFSDITQWLYSFARINRAPPAFAKHLQDQLLRNENLDAVKIAGAVWGASNINLLSNSMLPLVLGWLSLSDISDFKVPMVFNPDFEDDFLETFTATSLVQMAWTLLVHDYTEERFWQGRIIEKLQSIAIESDIRSTNQYLTTAKASQGEYEYFHAVDVHMGKFLTQTLAILGLELEPGHSPISYHKEYQHTKQVAEILGQEAVPNFWDQKGNYANFRRESTVYVLFDKDDYAYNTPGWHTVTGTDDLLMYNKVRLKLLEKGGYKIVSLPLGEWTRILGE